MNNILVATDFLEVSDKCLVEAANYAKNYGSQVFVIHWVAWPLNAIAGDKQVELHQKFNEAFNKQLSRVDLKPGQFTLEIVEGSNFALINQIIKKNNIGLVMVNHSTKSDFTRLFAGSFSEKAIFNLKAPVMLVKENRPVKTVGVSIDLTEDDLTLPKNAIEFAKKTNAKVKLFYVENFSQFGLIGLNINLSIQTFLEQRRELAYETLKNIEISLKQEGVSTEIITSVTVGEEPWKSIEKFIQSENIDLLCVQPHDGLFNTFHLGSTTLQLIKHTPINLVCFKEARNQ
jgi:nucleotide-binding universal stress UspA family protein